MWLKILLNFSILFLKTISKSLVKNGRVIFEPIKYINKRASPFFCIFVKHQIINFFIFKNPIAQTSNRLIYTFVLNFISVPNSNRIYKHNYRKPKLNACDCINYLIETAIGVEKT